MRSPRALPAPLAPLATLAAFAGIVVLPACDLVRDDTQAFLEEAEQLGPSTAGPAAVRSQLGAAPEAMSLLGEPLHPLVIDSAAEAVLRDQLVRAERARAAAPDDANAIIWVGRRLAYLGRYQEAIEVFTDGIARHSGDARLYRHRGHRYITVRELAAAVADLEHAARLVAGQDDVVEPDGQPNDAGIPRSTLQTNIWYHLGLARYLQGDFGGAEHAFRRGLDISPNDDMRVAMADWLWLTLARRGHPGAADLVLDEVLADSMEILENTAYHRRLRLYRGEVRPEALLPAGADALAVATYGYGLGTWHMARGDSLAARAIYDDVLATGYWPAFGFIAAEAELARMR